MKIEVLSAEHDRSSFDCGEPDLNEYLRRFAGQNDRGDTARAFVLVADDGKRVLGYFTLSMSEVERERFPGSRGLPRQVPVALIGRMATDLTIQGRGWGGQVLLAALRRCAEAARYVAARAVIVDALNDKARQFYVHHGFKALPDEVHPMRLFMAMDVVRKLTLDTPLER